MYEIEEKAGEQHVKLTAVDMDMDEDREAGRLLIKVLGVDEDWPTMMDVVRGRVE